MATGEGMTILGLHAENVRRLKVVSIYPPATGVVKITGRNAAGKSSTLDAIEYALGGRSAQPAEPIRRGQESAVVVADLGKFTVKRTWTPKGTYLTVERKEEGAILKVAKPQDFLDSLVGSGIGFDPLEFCTKKKPEEQVQMLLDVLQLPEDPREIDRRRKALYDERTAVNRSVKQAEAVLAELPQVPEGTPDEELSVSQLMETLQRFQAQQRANDAIRRQAEEAQANIGKIQADANTAIQRTTEDIQRLKAELAAAEARLEGLLESTMGCVEEARRVYEAVRARAAQCVDPDLSAVEREMVDLQTTNRHVRLKQQRAEAAGTVHRLQAEAARLTEQMEALDASKSALLCGAAMPIPELGITASNGGYGLTYRGIPLQDCSSSEKLRISMAIAMALTPRLRVILIREGSLLDADAKSALEAIAQEHGYQIWLEIVGTSKEDGAFIIEDGSVVEGEPCNRS